MLVKYQEKEKYSLQDTLPVLFMHDFFPRCLSKPPDSVLQVREEKFEGIFIACQWIMLKFMIGTLALHLVFV